MKLLKLTAGYGHPNSRCPKESWTKTHCNKTHKAKAKRILKTARETRLITCKALSRLSADFLLETLKAKREWIYIFKI